MKRIILLLTLLLLITACGKQEAPKQSLPERPETFYVPPPEPVKPMPAPAPAAPHPAPTPEPIVEPEPVKDVEPKQLPQRPAPVPAPIQTNACKVLTKTGTLYTMDDVEKGKISMEDFSDLKKCYPYFDPDQANTEAMCCVI